MRRIFIPFSTIFIISLLFFACGHLEGNDPLGVTGGGTNGYGSLGSSIGSGGGGGSQIDQQLLGEWRNDMYQGDYIIFEVLANGTFSWCMYMADTLFSSTDGTYSAANNVFTAYFGSETYHWPYSVTGDDMVLTVEGEDLEFYRVTQ